MKVLVTINFCPQYNRGLPSGSTVSEKEQGWERKDARQEATASSLMMRQGFPELTSSPHSLPLQTRRGRTLAPCSSNESRSFPKHRRAGSSGIFSTITPKITHRLSVMSVEHRVSIWPMVYWVRVRLENLLPKQLPAPQMLRLTLLKPGG